MRERRFEQVDVFAEVAYGGNPVAVVVDGDGLADAEMQRFANWTNLSETTFVVTPSDPTADYGVRIFTPSTELPFAGHPTLGTCHAWLRSGGVPHDPDVVVQECRAGLVRLRRSDDALAFAAPPTLRSGPVDADDLTAICGVLGISVDDVVAAQWVDNGPGWVAVLLRDADAVLAVTPGALGGRYIGVAGPHPVDAPEAFEVRGFFPVNGATAEDPVTGSLNASLAQWLLREGRAVAPFRNRQGTALGRHGVISVEQPDPQGDVWIGGRSTTCVTGVVAL